MPTMKCYGKYVENDPCYPFCSAPDGSGCDYGAGFGLTGSPYQVTYSDQGKLTGNFSTKTIVPVIDPYQAQVPESLKGFDGFQRNRDYMSFSSYASGDCPFAKATGTAESVTQGGTTTELTAVPRYSTKNFFKQGEMDGLSPRAASTKRWCYCFDKSGARIGKCKDENPTITGKRCHCCKQFED